MKIWCIALVLALAASAAAMPIATSARSMVPAEVQQIISVDYRALKDSPTAQALKQQVLPENLKQFEEALKGMGIEEERVRLEWISAAEGEKVKRVVNEMVQTVTQLGPLGIPQKFEEWDKEMEHFAGEVQAKDAQQGAPTCGHAQAAQSQKKEPVHA